MRCGNLKLTNELRTPAIGDETVRGGDQIASGTIMIAPHGHSWAHSPHPLQKS